MIAAVSPQRTRSTQSSGTREGAGETLEQRSAHTGFACAAVRSVRLVALLALLGASAGCSGAGRTPLVVYSPHGPDLLGLAERTFETLNPDVDVRWLDMGSQEALDRIRSERVNPQADVWFGGPSVLFQRAAAESLLAPYRPSWADDVAARGRGAGDLYFAAYETPAVIAYNSAAVPADQAPRDWDDVLAPRWRGLVLIRDPIASGTMRAIFGMVVLRGIARTGDTAAGFDWLRRLDAQTREYVLNPVLLDQKLVRREGLVSLWDLPDILVARAKGQPLGFALPTSGTPAIEDAIALVKGARHPEAARRFIEWVGSPAAQLLATRDAFRLPARLDLPADSLPEWARDVRRRLVIEPMDWAVLGERGDQWMSYWDRTVRGRGTPR
jgi:iron(III) transport system substrate-binding protein